MGRSLSTERYAYTVLRRDLPDPSWAEQTGKFKLEAFRLLFALLRVSPAYELARRVQLGPLTREDHDRVPPDFEDVLRTFGQLGDVTNVFFAEWWRTRGMQAFGNPVEPGVSLVAALTAGAEVDSYELKEANTIRENDGWPDAALLHVPLGMPRTKALRLIEAELDRVRSAYQHERLALDSGKTVGRIAVQRTITPSLVEMLAHGVDMLYLRAEHSSLSFLAFAKLAIPHKAGAKASSRVKVDRDDSDDSLRTNANRELKRFERFAENAARGLYPTDQAVSSARYSPATYKAIGERLAMIGQWEAKRRV